MEISEKNVSSKIRLKPFSKHILGQFIFSHERKLSLVSLDIFIFFSNFIGRASKLSLKLKKQNCQEYGYFRKKVFFFKIRLKPLPMHIVG
jgi:hypothetical protein